MRDIVSEIGTFYTGLNDLPVLKTTQTSSAVSLKGYDGCMIYILVDQYTDGTFTPVIQVAPDSNGSPGSWSAAPGSDLVTWQATSSSNLTPVKLVDSNGYLTGRSQPNAISSSATALNQRVGYVGGVQGVSDWLRVVSTISGSPSTGMGYDVIIVLGRPRIMPPSF
jgi:hypothetical protein